MSSGLEDGFIVETKLFICGCGFTTTSVYEGFGHIQNCSQYKNRRGKTMNNEIDMELTLNTLMAELKEISTKMKSVIDPYSKEVETLSKKNEEISKPFVEQSQRIQHDITELVLQRAKSYKCSSGNIQYRKGGIRRKWDLDGLDKMCEIDSYIKTNIEHLKTEEKFEPQVRIKVETEVVSINDL